MGTRLLEDKFSNCQENSGEKDTSTYSQIVKVIAKKTFRVIIFLGNLARSRLHYITYASG